MLPLAIYAGKPDMAAPAISASRETNMTTQWLAKRAF
jgi:hypothetical protein